MNYDVIIIGAGASGISAAIRAAERNRTVLLLEKLDQPGKKILASGNGRCNLMNTASPRYYGDPLFVQQAMQCCSATDLISFFKQYGLMLSQESEGRVYPVTFQASTVLSVLKNALKMYNVQIKTKTAALSVLPKDGHFCVLTSNGETFHTNSVIVSCGGSAQPRLGGTDAGYEILKRIGHTVLQTFPALVPLLTDSRSISGLAGVRIKCNVSVFDESDELLHTEAGEVLFTDYGISGICVMQCARFVYARQTYLLLDFLKGIFPDEAAAFTEIKRKQKIYSDFSLLTLLNGILNDHISYAVCKQAGIALRGEKASELSDENLRNIIRAASAYRINITGTKGFEYAQVTAGGADCCEFEASTMESKLVPGLFATGETLNVDGDCGGYNLMFAFISGLIAGNNV